MNIRRKLILTSVTWVLIGISCITLLLQSCQRERDPLDSTNPEWDNTKDHFPVYTIGDATYIVKEDGSLWARGHVFSSFPGTNAKGYTLIEDGVKKIANGNISNRLYVLKKDNSVWRSPIISYSEEADFFQQKTTEKITDNAKDVLTGRNFAVILKLDGTVWAIGQDTYGQFGLGVTTNQELPLIQIAIDVKQIAAGYSNIYLLKNDNSLWSAGNNIYGKLGYPSTEYQLTFKKVMDDVKIVRATENNVMLVKTDGSAWSFGSNANGNQGINESSQNPTYPHTIADGVKDVFPMGFTSFYLKDDGTLWACGSNSYGQMGVALPQRSLQFIQIAERVDYMSTLSFCTHIIILQDKKYRMAGRNRYKELQQSDIESFKTFTDFVMP